MKLVIILFIVVSSCLHGADDYKVVDAQTGESIESVISEDRGAFTLDAKVIGGNSCGVIKVVDANNPTSEFYILGESGIIVLGCTKIRPDYPQDDKLLIKSVVPQIGQYEKLGKEFYTGEQRNENNRLVVYERNTAALLNGVNDLQFVIQSNGFSPQKTGTIRVDRHFVKNGFYIQVVTFSKDDGVNSVADELNVKVSDNILATLPDK